MKVPFYSLDYVNRTLGDALRESFSNVLDSKWFIRGNRCSEFEETFAAYCGKKACVGVGNGLDALTLMLKASIIQCVRRDLFLFWLNRIVKHVCWMRLDWRKHIQLRPVPFWWFIFMVVWRICPRFANLRSRKACSCSKMQPRPTELS